MLVMYFDKFYLLEVRLISIRFEHVYEHVVYLFHTFRLFLVGGRIELRRSDRRSASKQLVLCNIRTDYAWLVRVTRLRSQTEYGKKLPFNSHMHNDVGLIKRRNVADFQIFKHIGLVAVRLTEKWWCYCFCNSTGWITAKLSVDISEGKITLLTMCVDMISLNLIRAVMNKAQSRVGPIRLSHMGVGFVTCGCHCSMYTVLWLRFS